VLLLLWGDLLSSFSFLSFSFFLSVSYFFSHLFGYRQHKKQKKITSRELQKFHLLNFLSPLPPLSLSSCLPSSSGVASYDPSVPLILPSIQDILLLNTIYETSYLPSLMKQLTFPSSSASTSEDKQTVSSSFLVKMSTIELIGAEILIIDTPPAFSLSSSVSAEYASRYRGITGIILGKSEGNLYLYNTLYQVPSSSHVNNKKSQRKQQQSETLEGCTAAANEESLEKHVNDTAVDDMIDEDDDDAVENEDDDNEEKTIKEAVQINKDHLNPESNEPLLMHQQKKKRRKGQKLRSTAWLLQQPIIKVKKSKISFVILLPDLSSSNDSNIDESNELNDQREEAVASTLPSSAAVGAGSGVSAGAGATGAFPSKKMKILMKAYQNKLSPKNGTSSSLDEEIRNEQNNGEAWMIKNKLLIFHPENKYCKK
jgi:hypothetical protein